MLSASILRRFIGTPPCPRSTSLLFNRQSSERDVVFFFRIEKHKSDQLFRVCYHLLFVNFFESVLVNYLLLLISLIFSLIRVFIVVFCENDEILVFTVLDLAFASFYLFGCWEKAAHFSFSIDLLFLKLFLGRLFLNEVEKIVNRFFIIKNQQLGCDVLWSRTFLEKITCIGYVSTANKSQIMHSESIQLWLFTHYSLETKKY